MAKKRLSPVDKDPQFVVLMAGQNLFIYLHNKAWTPECPYLEAEYLSGKDESSEAIKELHMLFEADKLRTDLYIKILKWIDDPKNMGPTALRTILEKLFKMTGIPRDEEGIETVVSMYRGQE